MAIDVDTIIKWCEPLIMASGAGVKRDEQVVERDCHNAMVDPIEHTKPEVTSADFQRRPAQVVQHV